MTFINKILSMGTVSTTDRSLQWCHNERDGSNHRRHDCLRNCLLRRRSKKTSKHIAAQRASNADIASIWWCHPYLYYHPGCRPALNIMAWEVYVELVNRSGAAADRRTPLKPGAQLDLASPYVVPRTRRTESPTSLNYAKLCVELNYTGAAIGEMWGDLVIRHIVLE